MRWTGSVLHTDAESDEYDDGRVDVEEDFEMDRQHSAFENVVWLD